MKSKNITILETVEEACKIIAVKMDQNHSQGPYK